MEIEDIYYGKKNHIEDDTIEGLKGKGVPLKR